MIYKLSIDGDTIEGTENERTRYWVRVFPADYRNNFAGARALLFDEFRRSQMVAASTFIAQERDEMETLRKVAGEPESASDTAKDAGYLIDFKHGGKTTRGHLVMGEDGKEISPAARAYLTDDPEDPLRFYVNFDMVDSAEACNSIFEVFRSIEEHFRKASRR